jgi:hypothetical protein
MKMDMYIINKSSFPNSIIAHGKREWKDITVINHKEVLHEIGSLQ